MAVQVHVRTGGCISAHKGQGGVAVAREFQHLLVGMSVLLIGIPPLQRLELNLALSVRAFARHPNCRHLQLSPLAFFESNSYFLPTY